MYTWIWVFLLYSWKIETLFQKLNIQSYRLCSFKTSALIGEVKVNLGCLSILFKLNGDRTNIDRINLSF